MADLNLREVVLLVPLAVLMVVVGFFPQPFLATSEPATKFLLETVEQKRLAALEAEGRPAETAEARYDGQGFRVEEEGRP